MAADGPLAGSGPGDLTRWQGTPWQSDAASCRSGYEPNISPVLPDVLAGPHPQPRAARGGLPDRRRHRARRWPTGRRRSSGASTGSASSPPPTAATCCGNMVDRLGRARDRHRAAGPDRRRLPGGDEGRDPRRVHHRADGQLERGGAGVEPAGVGRRARSRRRRDRRRPGRIGRRRHARPRRPVGAARRRSADRRRPFGIGEGAPPGSTEPSTRCSAPARSSPPTTCRSYANRSAWGSDRLTTRTSCSTRSGRDGTSTAWPSTPGCWRRPRPLGRPCEAVDAADVEAPVVIDAVGSSALSRPAPRRSARRRRPADGVRRRLRRGPTTTGTDDHRRSGRVGLVVHVGDSRRSRRVVAFLTDGDLLRPRAPPRRGVRPARRDDAHVGPLVGRAARTTEGRGRRHRPPRPSGRRRLDRRRRRRRQLRPAVVAGASSPPC